jgi:catalase-peroxidase
MAMNDEETVALIAGGHTFGKTHGAADPSSTSAPSRGRPLESRASAGEQLRQRQGRGRDHSGLEVTWTATPTTWEQQLLREPVRLRVGAVQEPGRGVPVEAEGRRRGRYRPGRPRPVEAARPDDADDRPLAPVRPGLRAHLAALPRAPGRVRRRLRAGVVQADPPRHGARSCATSARRFRTRR